MKNAVLVLLMAIGLGLTVQTRVWADVTTNEKLDKILTELNEIKKELQIIQVRVTQ